MYRGCRQKNKIDDPARQRGTHGAAMLASGRGTDGEDTLINSPAKWRSRSVDNSDAKWATQNTRSPRGKIGEEKIHKSKIEGTKESEFEDGDKTGLRTGAGELPPAVCRFKAAGIEPSFAVLLREKSLIVQGETGSSRGSTVSRQSTIRGAFRAGSELVRKRKVQGTQKSHDAHEKPRLQADTVRRRSLGHVNLS